LHNFFFLAGEINYISLNKLYNNGEQMKSRIQSLLALVFAVILFASALTQAQVTLRVGDAAPQFKAAKWFKGAPVTTLEKGKFYVVEFWATWCGPCKQSIPHLTELAHKFKDKVTIIGMDGSEHPKEGENPATLIENFLKEMGDKMDYNVALDTEDKFMSTNWMAAAAQFGIPCAFVVDNETKIAWIGHPMEMESALTQILDGKFDVKAYAVKFNESQDKAAKDAADRKKFSELAKPILDAYKAKDFAKVVSECEALVIKDPSLQDKTDPYYFRGLMQVNPEKLYSIAQFEKTKGSDRLMTVLGLFNQKGLDKKFYDLAIEVCVPKVAKDPNDYAAMSTLEAVYEITGDNAKALEMIDKMLTYAKANGANESYLKAWNQKIEKLKGGK
jgi:thiol-disulfide isomerase/thioredoxin